MRKIIFLSLFLILSLPSYATQKDFWCALDLNNSGEIDKKGEASKCAIGVYGDKLCPYGLKACSTNTICPLGGGFTCNNNDYCVSPTECRYTRTEKIYTCRDKGNSNQYKALAACEADCSIDCQQGTRPITPKYYCSKTDTYYDYSSQCQSNCAEIDSCVDEYSCPYGSNNPCKLDQYGNPVCTLLPCVDRNNPKETFHLKTDTTVPTSTGSYNSLGACIDELRLFAGKKSRCKLKGTQTAWKNCCKSDGKIYHDSQGTTKDVIQSTIATATMKGIAGGISAAYKAYRSTKSLSAASSAINKVWTKAFDPYSLAVSAAITIVMKYLQMQCNEESQFTALSKSSGTCHYLGKTCIEKWLFFGCVQKANYYCCFNSKMGRILQEEGRKQLGKGWGTPNNPKCEGFTPEEFQSLDFSRIDLSEYYSDLKPKSISAIRNSAVKKIRSKNIKP